jgi:hypothetical protein
MAHASYPRTRPAPAKSTLLQAKARPTTQAPRQPTQPHSPGLATSGTLTAMNPPSARPHISSTWDMDRLQEFNKKYLGQSDYDPTAAHLGKTFYDDYLLLSAIGNDIHTNTSARPPSPCNLLRTSFGKPSAGHSFTQDACFETAYLLVLKSGYFEPTVILALHRSHPLSPCSDYHSLHHPFNSRAALMAAPQTSY